MLHRGRHTAPVLVVAGAPGTVLREASDDRNERTGRLHHYRMPAWISDPIPGSRHDNHCLGESGVLLSAGPRNWLGDKGYIGNNMRMPFRKPDGGELLDWQKEFNKHQRALREAVSRHELATAGVGRPSWG